MHFIDPLESRRHFAQILQPDLNYGDSGAAPAFPDNQVSYFQRVDRHDRILRVSSAADYAPALTVQRLTARGKSDASFGTQGAFHSEIAGRAALGFQSDNKLLIVSNASDGVYVLRLTDAGTLDPTFGQNGQVVLPKVYYYHKPVIAQQEDGTIVVAYDRQIVRLSANGRVLRKLTFALPDGVTSYWTIFHHDAAGRLYAQYYTDHGQNAGFVNYLLRFTNVFAVDTTFGDNGVADLGTFEAASVHDDPIAGVQFQPGGGILVTGIPSTSVERRSALTRFTEAGAPDPTFASGLGRLEGWSVGAIDPRNGMMYGGHDALLMRLRPDGVRDRRFPTQSGASVSNVSPGGTVFGSRAGDASIGAARLVLGDTATLAPNGTLYLYGSLGNDVIRYHDSVAQVNAEPYAFATDAVRRVRVIGGGGNDRVTVDAPVAADIYTLGGNDTIATAAGNDTIWSGEGDDSISSGAGRDLIEALDGNDTILASHGDDEIRSRFGDDLVYAGAGNDTILNDEGCDTVFTGDGNDVVELYTNQTQTMQQLVLGDGSDRVKIHNSSRASVLGGAGDDLVNTGGYGYAIFRGGPGNDILDESARRDPHPASDLFDTEGVNRVLRVRRAS